MDYTSPNLVRALQESRRDEMDRVDDQLPDAVKVVVIRETQVYVTAAPWGSKVLLGQCVNFSGDGPDLDSSGVPCWSWAVGEPDGKGYRPAGMFGSIETALAELRAALGT